MNEEEILKNVENIVSYLSENLKAQFENFIFDKVATEDLKKIASFFDVDSLDNFDLSKITLGDLSYILTSIGYKPIITFRSLNKNDLEQAVNWSKS